MKIKKIVSLVALSFAVLNIATGCSKLDNWELKYDDPEPITEYFEANTHYYEEDIYYDSYNERVKIVNKGYYNSPENLFWKREAVYNTISYHLFCYYDSDYTTAKYTDDVDCICIRVGYYAVRTMVAYICNYYTENGAKQFSYPYGNIGYMIDGNEPGGSHGRTESVGEWHWHKISYV